MCVCVWGGGGGGGGGGVVSRARLSGGARLEVNECHPQKLLKNMNIGAGTRNSGEKT